MLGLRFTTDRQARTKKGHAAHSTTGAARAISTKGRTRPGSSDETGWPGSMSPMAMSTTGTARPAATHRRRVMSRSSGFSPVSSTVAVLGSSAMPHLGQSPGPSCSTSGCIGQV
jgi:hypothetical protein